MSASLPEIQQIPARHGTATFVPKGSIIKVINTYGRQVVDTWAFALPKPPSQQEMDEEDEREQKARRAHEEDEKGTTEGDMKKIQEDEEENAGEIDGKDDKSEQQGEEREASAGAEKEEGTEDAEKKEEIDSAEQDGEEKTEGKIEGEEKQEGEKKETEDGAQKIPGSETETDGEKAQEAPTEAEKAKEVPAEAEKPTTPSRMSAWSAYIPSITRSRAKPAGGEPAKTEQKTEQKSGQKSKAPTKAGEKRTWASYFSSGKGVSNYVPTSKSLSAFANSHYRDPTKSYAEQLYDFSVTPVGAGALSAASGSGYAGSAYAVYQAYTRQQEKGNKTPPMEYLSMPHCHTATKHLTPQVGDTLVSNLRKPMLTVVEDTAAHHDTLIAACDPQRYRELGVARWEEHGSCAENLVLALKELNTNAGLKGSRAVGTDVTVNTVPAPLNLFMNIPWRDDGAVSFEAPRGKKGEYVRLRAERDVVVVMSACPMDVTPVNGGKCMAAHFLVHEAEKKAAAAAKQQPAAKKVQNAATPRKLSQTAKTPAKTGAPVKRPSQTSVPTQNGATARKGSTPQVPQPAPKPGRQRPKKLERRTPSQTSAAQG